MQLYHFEAKTYQFIKEKTYLFIQNDVASYYLQIRNTNFKDFPISVFLFFQEKLEHDFEMTNYKVIVKPVSCPIVSTLLI